MSGNEGRKAKILAALTPEQVYGEHVELQRRGKNFVGPCCFHSEKTPSFTVSPGLWFRCWGCGKVGSAFDFVMEVEHVDFFSAMERLAAKAGISENGSVPHRNSQPPRKNTHHPITVAKLARDKNLPESDLLKFGLKDSPAGVVIPYLLSDGSPAPRQRIRTALSAKKGSRWDNSEGPVTPYGSHRLEEARGYDFICFVEGESDCWTLWHHGFPSLGIPGANMTACLEHEHLAAIGKIYILREPDKGGTNFVAGIAKRLAELACAGKVFVVSTAPFKDPNELHKANPENFPRQFTALLAAAEPLNLEMVGVFGRLASEVMPKRVEWLWLGRIPLAKITVLDGDPGLGKSALTLDLVARVTTGSPMPDGSPGMSGGALVLNAEDDEADTIVPRLAAMNAALDRVRILKTISGSDGERQPEIPGDLAIIEKAARSVHAKLIIIDPLMAFLGGATNSFRDQDVRRALAPLERLAELLGAAILIVRHLTKNSAEGNPLYRGGASIGIIGAARSGLLVARDPDDETGAHCILASTKSNLALLPASLGYSIQLSGESIRVFWTGESAHRATGLLGMADSPEERTAVQEAAEFLRSVLAGGALEAKRVLAQAKAAGFAEKTIQRAKAVAGVKCYRQGFGSGSNWMWEIPTIMAIEPSKMVDTETLAIFAQSTDSKRIESRFSSKMANPKELAINAADTVSDILPIPSKPEGNK